VTEHLAQSLDSARQSVGGRPHVADVVLGADARLLELCNHMTLLIWGLWLLMPFSAGVMASNHAWHLMTDLACQEFWGLISAALGFIGLGGLFHRVPSVRRLSVTVSFLFWLLTTVSIGTGTTWGSTGVPIYGMRAVFALIAYSRVARLGQADRRE
jgi:hypothetical protein